MIDSYKNVFLLYEMSFSEQKRISAGIHLSAEFEPV